MTAQTVQTSMAERIKNDLLQAWQVGHGGGAEKAHLLQGEDGLALMIPKGLLQAEIELSRKAGAGTRVIHNYVRELLHLVSSELIDLVEEFAQRRIDEVVPLVDLRAGWVIAFFRFDPEPVRK
jgi:Flp pilus assembly CpaF family ATPase